jgi:hypothetical protein
MQSGTVDFIWLVRKGNEGVYTMRMISLKAIKIAAIAMLMTSTLGLAVPVLADVGTRFTPPDGRYNAQTGDRIMVYLNGSKGISVWGLDTSNNGQPLTTFTAAELVSSPVVTHTTAAGKVTVTMLTPVTMKLAYPYYGASYQQWFVNQFATYQVSWTGGWGADGSAAFIKTFTNWWGF